MTSWPCFAQLSPSGGQSGAAAPLRRCNKSINKEIYIMSPAVIAGMTQPQLSGVWRLAVNELATADSELHPATSGCTGYLRLLSSCLTFLIHFFFFSFFSCIIRVFVVVPTAGWLCLGHRIALFSLCETPELQKLFIRFLIFQKKKKKSPPESQSAQWRLTQGRHFE